MLKSFVVAAAGVSVFIRRERADGRWFNKVRATGNDYENSIKQVVDLRRALDLLLAQPGVDHRPSYYVLMAGTTTLSEWYLLGKKPKTFKHTSRGWRHSIHRSICIARRGTRFCFSSQRKTNTWPLPRVMGIYAADHSLVAPAVQIDRLAWLRAHLF